MEAFQDDKKKQLKIQASMYAGLISGFLNKMILHPIDTIRAKIVVNQSFMNKKNLIKFGLIRSFIRTWKTEGIRGFYQGVGVSCFGSIPATGLYFWAYEKTKYELGKILKTENSFWLFLGSGMIAEACSCVLWVPLDILKERLQVQSTLKSFNYKNTFDAVKQICEKEGFFALYRAYGATIMVFGPYTGITLALYDKMKIFYRIKTQEISFIQSFAIALTTGGIASLVTNPLDVVKVRMQVQRAELTKGEKLEKGRYGYKNIFHGLYRIVQKEKFRGLFRGCYSRIIHMGATAALGISLMDTIRGRVMSTLETQK